MFLCLLFDIWLCLMLVGPVVTGCSLSLLCVSSATQGERLFPGTDVIRLPSSWVQHRPWLKLLQVILHLVVIKMVSMPHPKILFLWRPSNQVSTDEITLSNTVFHALLLWPVEPYLIHPIDFHSYKICILQIKTIATPIPKISQSLASISVLVKVSLPYRDI